MSKRTKYRSAVIELLQVVEECYSQSKRCSCYRKVERLLRRLVQDLSKGVK